MESLYRRPLPGDQIPFASPEGRTLFREALSDGTLEGYFALAEQHHTQADPAFCGLASLVVALNALAIDPGRLWKGPWRWFSEELLDCCVPLTSVRERGVTIDELACLAVCNGARSTIRRPDEADEQALRRAIESSSRSSDGPVLVASYSRAALGQTGGGHFSPIAGYHRGRDLALLLDVARFKYPPHWVPVPLLFEAMRVSDPATRRARGYIVLERATTPQNLAFVFASNGAGWQRIAGFLRDEVPQLLRTKAPRTTRDALHAIVGEAARIAEGIQLRDTADPRHRAAVETILGELRSTAIHAIVTELGGAPAELATVLLFLMPRHARDLLAPELADELAGLTDIDALAEPLRSDLRVLRTQLEELRTCSTA